MRYKIVVNGCEIVSVTQSTGSDSFAGAVVVDTPLSDVQLIQECIYVDDVLHNIGKKPHWFYKANALLKTWEDPRTLQDFKDAQWTQIKQSRTQSEYSGFTWNGSTFDSDATSQNRITGAVTLAQMSPDFMIGWVLKDNSTRTLNQTDMLQVGAALGQHVATQFAKGVLLREAIEAAASQAEVEAVTW